LAKRYRFGCLFLVGLAIPDRQIFFKKDKRGGDKPMIPRRDIVETIQKLVRSVEQDEKRLGVLSTREFLAVAFVLDRQDWLKNANFTMLEAVERLGRVWYLAALQVQRSGW
jgi:hypothetical protein